MKVCPLYEGVLLAEDGGEEAGGGDHEWDEGNEVLYAWKTAILSSCDSSLCLIM